MALTPQGGSNGDVLHLPITYKYLTDCAPTNTQSANKSVLTFSNDNGYTRLKFSGNISFTISTFNDVARELDFLKGEVNGVEGIYQIYKRYASDDYTIDLEYDGGNNFNVNGGTWNYYFSDYHIQVRVLNSSDEIIATIKATPDANNIIKFNINEIVKSQIDILGNTVPTETTYDADNFTSYKVSIAEATTVSRDGYTLSDYVGNFSTPSGGTVYNANLPFKQYFDNSSQAVLMPKQTFLTLFDQPSLFVGYPYDISFIGEGDQLVIKRYSGTTVLNSQAVNIIADDFCRYFLQRSSTEDSIGLFFRALYQGQFTESEDNPGHVGSEVAWDFSNPAEPTATVTNVILRTELLLTNPITNPVVDNADQYNLDITLTNGISVPSNPDLYFVCCDDSFNVLSEVKLLDLTIGVNNYSNTVTIASGTTCVGFYVSHNGTDASSPVTITSIDFNYFYATSSEKTIDVIDECANQSIYITWKNYFGGMEYWLFTAQKEYGIEIEETTEAEKNLFVDWPQSWEGDRITYQTSRKSRETVLVRAENLTLQQLNGLKYIKTSPLVQVVTGTLFSPITRNVIVDSDSFTVYKDGDKLYTFEFSFKYTDLIPAQSL